MSESTKQVWVVYQNTDLTEGRGREVPIYVCESKSTAQRLSRKQGVMGSDAAVSQCEAVMHKGRWCAPVEILSASKADVEADRSAEKLAALVERAKALGMTIDDLKLLAKALP